MFILLSGWWISCILPYGEGLGKRWMDEDLRGLTGRASSAAYCAALNDGNRSPAALDAALNDGNGDLRDLRQGPTPTGLLGQDQLGLGSLEFDGAVGAVAEGLFARCAAAA